MKGAARLADRNVSHSLSASRRQARLMKNKRGNSNKTSLNVTVPNAYRNNLMGFAL